MVDNTNKGGRKIGLFTMHVGWHIQQGREKSWVRARKGNLCFLMNYTSISHKVKSSLWPYLPVASDDPFIAGQFLQRHRAAGMKLLRADTYFST